MIGAFGNIVFEANSDTVRTFRNFLQRKTQRIATFDILDGSQKRQYLGNNLSEIEFEITLFSSFVNSIDEEIEKIEGMLSGNAYRLVIGGRNLGMFILEQISQIYKHMDGKGNLIGVSLKIKVKEYA